MIRKITFTIIVLLACINVKSQVINIGLDLGVKNQMNILQNGDVYEIETLGGDPWVKSTNVTQWYDPDTTYVLEFEYLAIKGVDDFRVYYDPFSGPNSVNPGKLPVAEGWTNFTVILKKSETWVDKKRNFFRFDFGKSAGQSLSVRNIRLRNITAVEYDAWKNPVDKMMNDKLLSYNNMVFERSIESVTVNTDNIIIKGIGSSSFENCFLSEILMHENAFDMNEFVFSQALSAQNTFTITLPRFAQKTNGDQYDRLYSRWSITDASGAPLAHAHWADDISTISQWDHPEEKPKSAKGMGGVAISAQNDINDLVELGVHNITFNLVLPSLFKTTSSTIQHELNGKVYNMNPNTVSRLDQMFKFCSSNDIQVSVILLIPTNTGGELGEIFTHPDATGGSYTLANVVEERGIEYYVAAIDYLSKRYFRPDKKYGSITQWIIHNEVDAAPVWTNAGDKPQDLYLEQYSRSMRAVYYTARKYNPTSKVFISLTHYWYKKHTYYCPELLQGLVDNGKREGDFEWGVAYHPYPENLRDPDTWNDVIVGDDLSTAELITPKNLELIDKWARTRENLYKDSKVRSVILSENGISQKDYSRTQMDLQAAGVAYYWKKLTRLPSIEAFHYHRWIDHALEGNLKFGLWSFKEGTNNDPGKKKPSWTLYKYAQTTQEDKAFEFTKKIIGISDWSEIYDEVNPELDLYEIRYEILQGGAPVNGAKVWYNKEMHKSNGNGKCTFYNVASSVGETSLKVITADNIEHTFNIDASGSKLVTVDLDTRTVGEVPIQVGFEVIVEDEYIPFDYSIWFGSTGVSDEQFNNAIKLYPNPTKNKFYIEYETQGEQIDLVEIISVSGSKYYPEYQEEGNRIAISTNNLSEGYYIVNITIGTVTIRKKICLLK